LIGKHSVVLRSLNPGDAGIRGCLNICVSITELYFSICPAAVPGFSLPFAAPLLFLISGGTVGRCP
jgi:hypothetical protein